MSDFNVLDFGAVGDGLQDDFPAFQKALDAINAVAGDDLTRGAILFIPSRKYRLSQPLEITRSIILQGSGQASSVLEFVSPSDTPLAGIIVQPKTHPDGRKTIPHRAIIRDLKIQTPKSLYPPDHLPATPVADDDVLLDGTYSGIVLYYKASVENCYVGGFEHDGIHINTSAGLGRNANSWLICDCFVEMNGRHGLFVSGGDANAGCALNLVCQENCHWGVYDKSFLGNTYVACLMESNGHINTGDQDPFQNFGGAYRTTGPVAQHVLLGCYSEGDQVSRIIAPTMVLGGAKDPSLIQRDPATALPVIFNSGIGEVNDLTVHGPLATRFISMGLTPSLEPQPIDPLENVILVNAETNSPGVFGPVPLTLPPLENTPRIMGRRYTIKRVDDANIPALPDAIPVTISVPPGAAEKIDGTNSVVLDQPYAWVTLLAGEKSTNLAVERNWYIIARG